MPRTKDGWELVKPQSHEDSHPVNEIRLQNARHPGWSFVVRFGPTGEVTNFAIDASDWRSAQRTPLNASFVHGLGVGAAIAEARVWVSRTAWAAGQFAERLMRDGTAVADEAERQSLRAESDYLSQLSALVSERTGTRGKGDVVFARVAAEYVRLVESGERAPQKRLADTLNLNSSTIRNQVYEARQRGLLTETRPGAKGGQLTAKGRRVLGEGT